MTAAHSAIQPLANELFRFEHLRSNRYKLYDLRAHRRFNFDAEELYQLGICTGRKFSVRCGIIDDSDAPYTVFFVVKNHHTDAAHITDLRYMIQGSAESARRTFMRMSPSEVFALFGF